MSEQPLLLELGRRAPTTKTMALRIRDEGMAAALDQAQRRADAATYQEVTCRSALNPVKGMPFGWTLNPYRGCTHACHYCFARRYQTQFELGPGDEFSSVIFVKVNLIDVLAKELDHPSWKREQVALGTATDPYQPIEGHYKLTMRALEKLHAARTPVGLVTKGPMVVRDAGILAEMSRQTASAVYVSVPTVDEDAWEALEPGTAHPMQRLRAVRQLRDAGVNVGVLMSPVVPGFSARPAQLEATIKAVAEHGALFAGANVMYLKGGTRDHFMGFVAREFPHMLEGFNALYPGAYPRDGYVASVRAEIHRLRERYRVDARPPRRFAMEAGSTDERRGPRTPALPDDDGSGQQQDFDW